MKVTTDACIQGAWTPLLPHVHCVLDIGAGTGLLSLMLAQRSTSIVIDGIEYDSAAAAQAADNATASPWSSRLQIIEGDATTYHFPYKYDLLISNPPFFNNSLLSGARSKDMARHTVTLTYTALLQVLAANLNDDGYASIMLPFTEYQQWYALAVQNGWFEVGKLSVRNNADGPVKRVVGLFSRNNSGVINDQELVIRNNDNNYTPEFIRLLSPFYLNV